MMLLNTKNHVSVCLRDVWVSNQPKRSLNDPSKIIPSKKSQSQNSHKPTPHHVLLEVGMNSDRMAISAAQRAKAGKALGTVIVPRCKGVGRFKVMMVGAWDLLMVHLGSIYSIYICGISTYMDTTKNQPNGLANTPVTWILWGRNL